MSEAQPPVVQTQTSGAAGSSSRPARHSLAGGGFAERFELMVGNINKVIKGKDEIIRLALTALVANGHILFEDYPGTGKTMLARSISSTIHVNNNRIQCTPDLLPADMTGSPVLDRKSGEFTFRPGPVFSEVLLADEVNRATPKTQSALLEAMGERQVTVDGVTRKLPSPFFVLATQNPIELAGTFPLPEAQLDRFLFKLSLGYTDREAEVDVIEANRRQEAVTTLGPVVDGREIMEMIEWAAQVTLSREVMYYIVDLVQATRDDPALQLGASSRASLALAKASAVSAAAQGRDDVLPDDVKALVEAVFRHRLLLTPDALLREDTVDAVVERIVHRVKVPMGMSSRRGREDETVEAVASEASEATGS